MPNFLDTEFHISIDKAVNIQVKLNLFACTSLFHLIFKLYLDVAFHPICDYTSLDWKCFETCEQVTHQSSPTVLLTDSFVYVSQPHASKNIKQNTPHGLSGQSCENKPSFKD